MQFADCVRSRKMCRSFRTDPIDSEIIKQLVDLASRAPTAGKTQGWHLVVLQNEQTNKFWDTTLPEHKRSNFKWQQLLNAPVIALVLADPQAYLDRYSEPDKTKTNLGEALENWPTPYWTVDASFATMQLLLGANDIGLGALFFAVFSGESELRELLKIPTQMQLIGAVALGWPSQDVRVGISAKRRRRTPGEIIHLDGF